MTRPTPEEIEEIRETVGRCEDSAGQPDVMCDACRDRMLLAEIDALRGELAEERRGLAGG